MGSSIEKYLRPDVIQQVQRLDLKARFIIEGLLAGLHRSPYHGFSVEFSEHRRYSPGDDLRMIDWNVYAKTDRFYVRKYEAETNLDAWLLVDQSASMNFSRGGRMSKMDYALCLAASLGYMMIRQQDSVGLVTFDDRVRAVMNPRSTRTHLMNLLGELARTKPAGTTLLSEAIHDVARRIRKRSLVILLSDLLSDQEQVVEALHHLKYRGHDLIIFQILDRSELDLDYSGAVRFEDPETGQAIDADPRAIRRAYQQELEQFIETYRRESQAIRADFISVDNSMTFDKALVQFLVQRQGR